MVADAAARERKRLGLVLRQLREGRNLTQAEASERIGIHHNTLVRVESGDANMTIATLVAIGLAYKVPLRSLF